MVRTIISAFVLTTFLAAQSADHGRAQTRASEVLESNTSWSQLARLSASDGTTSDYLGVSVAIDGDTVVVGALTATINGNTNQGAA